MSDWANVASLGKPKNLKGGLLAYAREGLPFLLSEGMEVIFVPPVLRIPRGGKVISVVDAGSGAYLVQFDSIDSIDLAEHLQDHFCLVRKTDLPEDYENMTRSFIGFKVVDAEGSLIGEVIDIQENPAHPLLVVERVSDGFTSAEGQSRSKDVSDRISSIQIPFVDDFVVNIDDAKSEIMMDLPDGMLDL